ncbi:hypothetical protein BKA70DRAFT_1226022 [Coprinopsis sp. MPI-PUGE-AT-0042]|nr:hypothetical protein BKA70DRAFT_1226022 [Coprinopsis sp. MPI-PUGE-AT-0042]
MEAVRKGRLFERTDRNDNSSIGNIMSGLDSASETEDEREYRRIFCRGRQSKKMPLDFFGGTPMDVVGPSMAKERIEDRASLVKRGLMPISSYDSSNSGIVPGPGTVSFSHLHYAMHKELKAEERVLDMTGSLATAPQASTAPLSVLASIYSLGMGAYNAASTAFLNLVGSN